MRRWIGSAVLGAASLAAWPGMLMGQSGFVMAAGPGSHGTQGYLGVDIRDVGDDQVGVLKLKEARGAEVMRVDHDGPAAKAGLREHDVIQQVNGQVVEGSEQLKRMLRETPPGHTVSLLVSRDGQQQTVSTRMANREELERQAWEQHMTVPDPDGASAGPGRRRRRRVREAAGARRHREREWDSSMEADLRSRGDRVGIVDFWRR